MARSVNEEEPALKPRLKDVQATMMWARRGVCAGVSERERQLLQMSGSMSVMLRGIVESVVGI